MNSVRRTHTRPFLDYKTATQFCPLSIAVPPCYLKAPLQPVSCIRSAYNQLQTLSFSPACRFKSSSSFVFYSFSLYLVSMQIPKKAAHTPLSFSPVPISSPSRPFFNVASNFSTTASARQASPCSSSTCCGHVSIPSTVGVCSTSNRKPSSSCQAKAGEHLSSQIELSTSQKASRSSLAPCVVPSLRVVSLMSVPDPCLARRHVQSAGAHRNAHPQTSPISTARGPSHSTYAHHRRGNIHADLLFAVSVPILNDCRSAMESWGASGTIDPFEKIYEVRPRTCDHLLV